MATSSLEAWSSRAFAAAVGIMWGLSAAAGEGPRNPLEGASIEEVPARRAKLILEAAPDAPRVRPKRPRKVLVWITPAHLMAKVPHRHHTMPYGTCAMKTLGEKTGAYEPVISNDQVMLLPQNLAKFDAIILQNSAGPWITPSDEALDEFRRLTGNTGLTREAAEEMLKKALLDWVREGHGVMAYHFAVGANPKWTEFHEMLGARFAGHPWNEEVGIRVEEPGHPLVAAFEGKDFRLREETFQFREPYSRDKLRVLLSLDTESTNMSVKNIKRKDNDFALAWVRTWGKGRVFYTAFGHRPELYWNPRILQFYLDGIQFATGDLEAPAEPRPGPGTGR
jgi:type 1 glutamine amidotransferase